MKQGLVTTIIPTYNRSKMLVQAVNSVLNQDYSNIEIIIVNDGSTDNTLQVAQELANKSDIVKVISIENSGPAIARQHGLNSASGEFIQYLDCDDLLHKEKFTKQVGALNKNNDVGVSYCIQQLCDINGHVLDSAWMRSGEKFNTMFPAMLGGRIWGTPVPLYRSSLLKRSGPWLDCRNQEDWEYDCRVAGLGVTLDYQAETLVTIRRHELGHFGNIDKDNKKKLIDKTTAYLAIYQHAVSAKISKSHVESLRFNRMAFMLARQCANNDLIHQCKELMTICKSGTDSKKRQLEYWLFTTAAFILSWKLLGKVSNFIDKYRS